MPKIKKTLKTDYDRHESMPKKHAVFSFQHQFTLSDYKKIQRGFIPQQQEDKWFIYFEDNKLYCHRSWTGYCIYVVDFEIIENNCHTTKITINRDKEQYSETDDKWDCHFAVYLIHLLLLHKPFPYPEKEEISPDLTAIQQ